MIVAMGSKMVLSKDEWKTLRELAESGKDDQWLSDEFGISCNTIRQKRFADKRRGKPWLTPKEVEKKAAIDRIEKAYSNLKNGEKPKTDDEEGGEKTGLEKVSPSELAHIRDHIPGVIAKQFGSLLLASLPTLPPPKDITEFNVYHNIFRKAASLDGAGGVAIQINNNGMQWSSSKEVEKPIVLVKAEKVA